MLYNLHPWKFPRHSWIKPSVTSLHSWLVFGCETGLDTASGPFQEATYDPMIRYPVRVPDVLNVDLMQCQTDVFFFILYSFPKTLCVPFCQLVRIELFRENCLWCSSPSTKWVGDHYYAHSWQLYPEQGKKHQRVVLWSVVLGETSLPSLCAKLLPWMWTKADSKEKVWDRLDLWLLMLAEGVAKTLVQREQVVCCKGKGLHFMPRMCLLALVCTCTGETQQSWTRF